MLVNNERVEIMNQLKLDHDLMISTLKKITKISTKLPSDNNERDGERERESKSIMTT